MFLENTFPNYIFIIHTSNCYYIYIFTKAPKNKVQKKFLKNFLVNLSSCPVKNLKYLKLHNSILVELKFASSKEMFWFGLCCQSISWMQFSYPKKSATVFLYSVWLASNRMNAYLPVGRFWTGKTTTWH